MTDEQSELQKITEDMVMYGKAFIREGERVAPEDVYISQEKAMTNDLVKRLRLPDFIDHADAWDLCDEAADRIEQLEAALRKIAQHDMQAVALDALRPGERVPLAGEKKDD